MQLKQVTILGLLAISLALSVNAQNRTKFAGTLNAVDFAYGFGNVGPLSVSTGAPAGTTTLTLNTGYATAGDGTAWCPLAVNAPVTIGSTAGGNLETETPSAVVCSAVYGTASVTATWTYAHGQGESIITGTFGIQEAIDLANSAGGGVVALSPAWATLGGTDTIIRAAAPYSSVTIQDNRGSSAHPQTYWSIQPTTLTSLAVPTTLAAGTVVFSAAPVGTWAASAYYFCVTYVDAMGGEGPCSATYNQTPTVNYSLKVTSPAASTGAVGWRMYAGASYNAAYLLPITATNCTLTTLESVIPACAIGAAGTFLAPPVSTTSMLRPNGQTPTVNLAQPMPQGHTTFGYQPTGNSLPVPFQTHYGPFPSFGSTTTGQIDYLGSVNLPAGYLNAIGRTVRVSGKILGTTFNTAVVPSVIVYLGWAAGTTAGAPVAVCTMTGAAVGSTATANIVFSCTMTTNATGATGTIQPDGFFAVAPATGAALETVIDSSAAAIGSLSLTTQNTLVVGVTSGSATTANLQLLDLSVETLQ